MDASELLGVPATPLLTVEEAAGALRVPRWALLELALAGRVVRLCDAPVPSGVVGGE